ncbi:hypothetical protein [Nocardia crassostreae]|uniref:hypothetical protein n=1 Tax=Nocardia crassostreae TaxID=53428 RepID=UPI0008335E2C|nr:hypothetical protein [Nocardia crassostreae]
MASSSIDSKAVIARLSWIGPIVLAGGLTLVAVLQHENPGAPVIAAWAAEYVIAGAGIGMAMPHLTAAVMAATPDPDQAAKASAALNTVGLFAFAFGSALGGALLNLGHVSLARSAHNLLFTLAALALAATLAAVMARRADADYAGTR